jgi:hypothetical protein
MPGREDTANEFAEIRSRSRGKVPYDGGTAPDGKYFLP